MPYDKGDFTQQGINGDVSALVRLNEKRVVKVVLSSDDEIDNCDISGGVYDLLNGTSYSLGGTTPTGNIEFTENTTEPVDVSQYATATVNVSGGVELLKTVLTLINEQDTDIPIPAGSFLHDYAIIISDFIDYAPNRLTTHIDTDNELHVLDLSNLIPTVPANTTATYNLYYLSNDTSCNPGIEFAEHYGSQLSNMTFDTDGFYVDDAIDDSAITLTWDK